MKKKSTNTTRLGIFVVLTLVLFTVAVYNIGSKQNLFGTTFQISSYFRNVNGLQAGNNVRYAGINVGSVDQIVIINDSTLRVDMKLEEQVRLFIKKDALVSIGTDGFVGNRIVNISPGNGHHATVTDGDTLQSYTKLQTTEMLNSLGSTTENIALLTVNLLAIAENVNKGSGSVARLINDAGMAEDMQMTVRNLRNATQQLDHLTTLLSQGMERVEQGKGLLGMLLKDTLIERELLQITAHFDTLVEMRIDPILQHLEGSGHEIAKASAQLNDILASMNEDQGLIRTVLTDSTVSDDFKSTLYNLKEGTDRFNQNMEALKHNVFFRSYFKKQERKRRKELRALGSHP